MTNQNTNQNPDRLPPHSEEAERAVLGCVLLDPSKLRTCLERFAGAEVFYVFANRVVFECMCALERKGRAIDVVTLQQELHERQQLEGVGGIKGLSELPDETPSAENLSHYLDIVWEKYLARLKIQQSLAIVEQIQAIDGLTEPVIARARELETSFEAEVHRGTMTPRYLKDAGDFSDEVWNEFFGNKGGGEPGWSLPIEFKLKKRLGECTLVTGDDGSGKSTFLNYCALHVAAQGGRIVIASFEMHPKKTIWMLVCQLLGTREIPESNFGKSQFVAALAWIAARVSFYSFLGIADWRDVLDTFRFAARHRGFNYFILDSVMRIGIGDDDYALQGLVAAQFAQFTQEYNVHLDLVIHENKGGEKGKAKVRGSKLWTANVDNVVKIEINSEKKPKLDDLWADLQEERAKQNPSESVLKEIEEKREQWKRKWDSHLLLLKQRYPGSQQNGSKFVYYDARCFQFREHRDDPLVNWCERWTERHGDPDPEAPEERDDA
jgi:hypothetical protein